jgi:putative ubiquitin-RnfH superfamily antitoxin RatB of RatAB toxin-antitoxin module
VSAEVLNVEVVYSPGPRVLRRCSLELPAGSTVQAAVAASGLLETQGDPEQDLSLSVWGRLQPPDHVLRDRDRVEICRALTVDPKEARRLRYKREGRARRAP